MTIVVDAILAKRMILMIADISNLNKLYIIDNM